MRQSLLSCTCLTIAVVLQCSNAVIAGPLNYVESVDGDLPHVNSFTIPLPILTLDAGTNTIRGTSGDYVGDGVIDWDSFAFRVPVGLELIGGQLELTRSGSLSGLSWQIFQGSPNFRGGTLVEKLDPDFFAVFPFPMTAVDPLNAVPLPAGIYNVSAWGLGGMSGQPKWGTYTFTFDVRQSAVPEPASCLLFGLGALGLAGMRRRKGRRTDAG